jgi:Tfp pilus assembly protein PilX
MLMLFLMTMIGLSTMELVTRDRQSAGYQSQKRVAFYAAEAGLSETLRVLEETGSPEIVPTSLGDSSLFPHGQPTYQPDPTVTDAVEDLGTAGLEGHTANVGGSSYQLHTYRVRIQGASSGGVTSTIEVTMGVFAANTSN